MTAPIALILGGCAGVGKDEVAARFASLTGAAHLGMSDPMLEMALAINPIISAGIRLRQFHAASRFDWPTTKTNREVRRFLQALGTEAGRGVLGDDVWVDVMRKRAAAHLDAGRSVVVTGGRFDNELKAVRDLGGYAVLVTRPGYGPVNDHESERLAGQPWKWDIDISNAGTLGDLNETVCDLADRLTSRSIVALCGYGKVRDLNRKSRPLPGQPYEETAS